MGTKPVSSITKQRVGDSEKFIDSVLLKWDDMKLVKQEKFAN